MSQWLEALLSGLGAAFLVGVFSFGGWIVRKLSQHDTALAVLISQVNPPGDKSLREMLHEIQLETVKGTRNKIDPP